MVAGRNIQVPLSHIPSGKFPPVLQYDFQTGWLIPSSQKDSDHLRYPIYFSLCELVVQREYQQLLL